MPREDEPRLVVRFSKADFAVVEAAASAANVAVGALVRQCAVRYAGEVASAVGRGEVTGLRRQRIETAVEATGGRVAPASSLVRVEGVGDAGWSRQQRVNAQVARARGGGKK